MLNIRYEASPTCAKLHASHAIVKAIRGPVGSGKSVGCITELFRLAVSMPPCSDGVRRSRWALIRNTYPELKSTTIKTFQDWIPSDVCPIKYDAPITGRLQLPMPDGTFVAAEFIFLALDSERDMKKLLSLELTGAFINEAREVPYTIVKGVQQRIGRYPKKADGADPDKCWFGLIMDTNPPDESHWWAQIETGEWLDDAGNPIGKMPGWEFFIQPPALLKIPPKTPGGRPTYVPNPAAENVQHQNKGYAYWLDQIPGATREYIDSFILNRFALVINGKAVFGDHWSPDIHVAKTRLWPVRGSPVIIGLDFGLTPAAVIVQPDSWGQLRVLDELTTKRLGVRDFAKHLLKPLLKDKYKGKQILLFGDPAGVAGRATSEGSAFEHIEDELGIPVEAAITNRLTTNGDSDLLGRHEVVRWFLCRGDERRPGMLVDPACKTIVKGFNGGYHYESIHTSTGLRLKQMPAKNEFSHPHDALQYAALGVRSTLS